MYIVIEGQDATGKDTQAEKLAEYFRAQGKNVVHYAESGTASKNDFIRQIAELNYGGVNDIDKRTRVLLYIVNRYEQFKKYAEPALAVRSLRACIKPSCQNSILAQTKS